MSRHVIQIRVTPTGWDGTVNAKQVARQAEQQAKADKGTSRSRVDVLPDRWRAPLVAARSDIRAYVYNGTTPWLDGGWRMLPSDKLNEFLAGLQPLIDAYKAAGDKIKNERDEIDLCNRARLGNWNESMTLPGDMDWDVEINRALVADPKADEYCKANKKAMEEEIAAHNQRLNDAVATLSDRVKEIIESIVQKTKDSAAGKNVKFGSLRQQIVRTSKAIKDLNVTGDKTLDRVADEIAGWKMDVPPDVQNVAKLLGIDAGASSETPKVSAHIPEAPKAATGQPEAKSKAKAGTAANILFG
jgi:putative ubiquitin-RnfH superfamily antitoxin RatB of RatAB toxin-antitoxin module